LDLEIRHLRLVAGIADTGSVTKAAVSLNLTQSALSHQLRDIEARFKTPLFLRVGKRMVLTAAGQRVLETARRVLDELGGAEADVRRIAQCGDGVIRVATECNTGYHWLPPLLRVFNRKHPRVTVNVMPDTTRPVQALLEGRLDVAILTSAVSDRRLRLRPLFDDEMVAVVARTHPLARQPWVSARDLAAQHLLVYSSSPEESFVLQRVLAPAGLAPAQVSFITSGSWSRMQRGPWRWASPRESGSLSQRRRPCGRCSSAWIRLRQSPSAPSAPCSSFSGWALH
jgi:LysR family transcriptional regulator for metE and metH